MGKYEVLSVKNILEDVTDVHEQFLKVDSFTMAKVYKGKSGSYYLLPAVGNLGIKVNDIAVIDSILLSRKIPIPEKSPSIFQINKEAIENIEKEQENIVSQFLSQNNLSWDELKSGDFLKLDAIVNQLMPKKRYDDLCFTLGLLIGKIMKETHNVHWVLEKRYGYNPYFEPMLEDRTDSVLYNPWYTLSRNLVEKTFSFKNCLENALVVY
jgi:hypothetical protein